MLIKMLGDDLIFWKGKNGIVAFHNSCPHRGGMLHQADHWWEGTITCTYHGWTFDETGECIAVLGEGPESKIPFKPDARTIVYPTRTLKNIVFVWMGLGEPAPIEEDVPAEFFDDETVVTSSVTTWPCNWRPALENVYDAHVQYVHRNSTRNIVNQVNQAGPWRLKPDVINGRALILPSFGGRARRTSANGNGNGTSSVKDPESGAADAYSAVQKRLAYQEYFPAADLTWPRTKTRLLWTWAFRWMGNRQRKRKSFMTDQEWAGGHHLPSMFRTGAPSHLYTRWVVPVDQENSRVVYFHTAKPKSWLGRAYERFIFHTYHDWSMNYNFSGQDARQMIYQYYEFPEKLSATDIQSIQWRKLLLTARGVQDVEELGDNRAEAFAEALEVEMKAESSAS
jgi:phenylpropionate dioxygenase-like ring-hydroxylating dioxygenase large terminal subunit